MREVGVLGVGLHKFGRFPEKTVEDLGRVAILNALDDAGMTFNDIETAFCGRVYASLMGAGLRVVGEVGQTGIPIVNMEVACTSSTQGLTRAAYEIASGLYDAVLAVGVEKMQRGLLVGTAQAGSFEEVMGFAVMPAIYALKARKHMKLYGTTAEQLALCSVKEHKYGVLNPNAQYRKECTLEEVLNSRMITDPITLLMCSLSFLPTNTVWTVSGVVISMSLGFSACIVLSYCEVSPCLTATSIPSLSDHHKSLLSISLLRLLSGVM